jgi:hypothetical protein
LYALVIFFNSITSTSNFSIICALRNEALRVAFIDVVENLRYGKVNTEHYSKLVKADINGKDKVTFFYTFYTLLCVPLFICVGIPCLSYFLKLLLHLDSIAFFTPSVKPF